MGVGEGVRPTVQLLSVACRLLLVAGPDIIVTTLPRWGGGEGAVEPGGSDDGMTITITISSGSSGTDDLELQAILAKCVKK